MKFIVLFLTSFTPIASFTVRAHSERSAFVLKADEMAAVGEAWFDSLDEDKDEFGAIRGLFDGGRNLQMSMSMSFSYNIRPTSHPVGTQAATVYPEPTVSFSPSGSFTPTLSSVPSGVPSNEPSSSPSGSVSPTSSPSPTDLEPSTTSPSTLFPTVNSATMSPSGPDDIGVYECTDQGVILAGTASNDTTVINLSLAYAAEINGTDISPETMRQLEFLLLEAAIAAALGCDAPPRTNRLLAKNRRNLLALTDILGTCNATIDEADCLVLETDLAFIINEDINPQYAAYASYLALKEGMTNDTFVESLEEILRLTYLAPLPLVPPPNTTQPLHTVETDTGNDGGNDGDSKTKSWTIGACVVMSTGGLVALGAWFYNRRIRQKRHVELIDNQVDDRSNSPVSLFSAEQDYVEDA